MLRFYHVIIFPTTENSNLLKKSFYTFTPPKNNNNKKDYFLYALFTFFSSSNFVSFRQLINITCTLKRKNGFRPSLLIQTSLYTYKYNCASPIQNVFETFLIRLFTLEWNQPVVSTASQNWELYHTRWCSCSCSHKLKLSL